MGDGMNCIQIWLKNDRAYYVAQMADGYEAALEALTVPAQGLPRTHRIFADDVYALALEPGAEGVGLWQDPSEPDMIYDDIAEAIDCLKPGRYPVYRDGVVVEWFDVPADQVEETRCSQ